MARKADPATRAIRPANARELPDDLIATDFDANFNTDTHILELRWELSDDYRFDAVYGHWSSSETVFTDWDGTPDMLYHTDRPGDWEQDSVELRISNGGDDAFSWVGGVFFWKSSFDIWLRSYIGFAVTSPATATRTSSTSRSSASQDNRLAGRLLRGRLRVQR